jgi:hypothetical protein
MHKSTIALLFGVLLAGTAVAAEPVAANVQDYAGRYVLDDGRILNVDESNGKLTAVITERSGTQKNMRYNGAGEVILKADGLGSFKSTTSPLQITFRQDATGSIEQVNVNERANLTQTIARR